MRNKSNSYDKLSDFSKRLIGLAAFFEVPIEKEQFAKVLPEIHYQIHTIRSLEFVIKEKIFTGAKAQALFAKADTAIYHAEYILKDTCSASEREHNLAISRELIEAAVMAGKMAMEGYGRQKTLGGA